MPNYSKVSFALVACWLLAVTIVSDFLTFSSGSTTGSVGVLSETSLQSVVSAPSTEFTVLEFYTLTAPGATPANTASFTAVVSYPEITTATVFPAAVSSTALVTSPFSTSVHVVYTLILASITPVGSPCAGLPATTLSHQDTTLRTSTTSTSLPELSPTPTPVPSTASVPIPEHSSAPSPAPAPPEPTTKAAAPVATDICGRPGQAGGGNFGG